MARAKIALFFGAGTEIGYGLPSGGKFALDLFRTPVEEDKAEFRKQLEKINNTSHYATKWLPNNYLKKRIHVFGKGDFEGIVTSSLEYRREEILTYLENFDEHVHKLLRYWSLSEEEVRMKYKEEMGFDIGDISYGQAVKLNNRLAESVRLFESDFFSAMLKILETQESRKLQRTVRAILELLIGSCGQRLISTLNEELFESAPEKLSVFDDLSGIFSLDYRTVGQTGMEIVLEEKPIPVSSQSSLTEIMIEVGRIVLEDLYSKAMDYQALIDSHFRYLYNPRAHWAKFTRISIFLHTVRRYISTRNDMDMDKLADGPGYYHDLEPLSQQAAIMAIGTTNYNSYVEQVLASRLIPSVPVYHLNGSVDEFYDPYCNNITIANPNEPWENGEHLLVPFMFTQSGVKPLTSITMSRKYVELYDKFKQSDIVCIIGYSFSGDDGHINGLFRALAVDGKKLIIFHYGDGNDLLLKREYQAKLRLTSPDHLDIFRIDENRTTKGIPWWERALQESLLMSVT
ncbi:hypothetical protein ACFQI7_32055 [Paenibacillus allorhizosphaerae]|uniref:SIR2-like domain-containing protein n=1 Tax=Paenibacillus allorhizosphaerae TaxID=2849866 RepID=A0ABM8VQB0_9BACL|nr:hypothetical protein [Paenibacillus allorhizosphaerae]CAG7653973.1 hypothetical protein PAECIP111802_05638 [Paenibacillus allorhizosphaerae]